MDINLPTIILQTISLFLLMYGLKKLLYKPVLELLDKRVDDTNRLIEKTEETHKNAEVSLDDAKKQLENAKKEALNLRESAKSLSLREREDILSKTEKDSQQLVGQAKEEIANDVEKAKGHLKGFVADISVDIAEKVLMREFNQEDRKRYVKFYTKEIEESK